MKFRTSVEPPEPMKGLEIPPEVVEALGGGKRPAVTITINRHSWNSRVAILRGRYLPGLSTANRGSAHGCTGRCWQQQSRLSHGTARVPASTTQPHSAQLTFTSGS